MIQLYLCKGNVLSEIKRLSVRYLRSRKEMEFTHFFCHVYVTKRGRCQLTRPFGLLTRPRHTFVMENTIIFDVIDQRSLHRDQLNPLRPGGTNFLNICLMHFRKCWHRIINIDNFQECVWEPGIKVHKKIQK